MTNDQIVEMQHKIKDLEKLIDRHINETPEEYPELKSQLNLVSSCIYMADTHLWKYRRLLVTTTACPVET